MRDGAYEGFEVSERRRAFDRTVLRGVARAQLLAARHWLFVLNVTSALYVGLAYLAPLLTASGWGDAGQMLFGAYALACHQLPRRSFFVAGHQVAFCQRDVAIFASIALAGLVYATRRGRVRALGFKTYLLTLVPMAIDGGTQALGWRESTRELRVVTGVLFGITTVWWLYPYIEQTMIDLRSEALDLMARADEGGARRSEGG